MVVEPGNGQSRGEYEGLEGRKVLQSSRADCHTALVVGSALVVGLGIVRGKSRCIGAGQAMCGSSRARS